MMASHRRTHRRVWAMLALLLPAVLGAAFWLRRVPADAAAPVELEAGKGRIR